MTDDDTPALPVEPCPVCGLRIRHPKRHENRPTATPSPNRPDHTLEGPDHAEPQHD